MKTVVSGIEQTAHTNRSIAPPKTQGKDEAFFAPRSPKSGEICDEFSRIIEAHKALSHFSHFAFGFASCLRNLYFYSVFGTSPDATAEKGTFPKPPKNQGQKKKLNFQHLCPFLGGHEAPMFVVFERPPKGWVQLSSLEVAKMGFN